MSVIWVTGAKGFVGRHLAKQCANAGHTVGGVGHGAWPSAEAKAWGVTLWINCDVNRASLDQLGSSLGVPKVIYHVAGGSSVAPSLQLPNEDFRRTVASSMEVLDWVRSRSHDTRVVIPSSAAVYGDSGEPRIREAVAPRPSSPYGAHKLMVELACDSFRKSFDLETVAVRLFSVYGVGLRKQLLWDLCKKLEARPSRLTLSGSGQEFRDWIHVSDVVRLLALVGESPDANEAVVNGGTGIGTSVASIAECVSNAWGHRGAVTFSGELRPGDPRSLVADPKLATLLGFQPEKPWQEGVTEYVQWYRELRLPREQTS